MDPEEGVALRPPPIVRFWTVARGSTSHGYRRRAGYVIVLNGEIYQSYEIASASMLRNRRRIGGGGLGTAYTETRWPGSDRLGHCITWDVGWGV